MTLDNLKKYITLQKSLYVYIKFSTLVRGYYKNIPFYNFKVTYKKIFSLTALGELKKYFQ